MSVALLPRDATADFDREATQSFIEFAESLET